MYKLVSAILIHFLSASAAVVAEEGNVAVSPDYQLEPGDVLAVSVWKEEGLQLEVLVRPDGKLSFPLAGEIQGQGRSVEQVRQQITDGIAEYISDPVVTVSLIQNNGNRVYVLGRVNKPGEFGISRNIDVMQALAMAGGLTPFAVTKDIRILRRDDGVQQSIGFNYNEVEKGINLGQNIVLQAGDVIVVP